MSEEQNKHFEGGDPALRAAQAQAYLGLRHSSFYKLIADGKLRQGVLIGRARIWRRSWLDEFLDGLDEKSVANG